MFGRKRQDPEWYVRFLDDLETFARELPPEVERRFERKGSWFSLDVKPLTPRHRRLILEGGPAVAEYELGKVWTDWLILDPEASQHLLAMCDSVRDGRVRELRDLDTRLFYHVYRLRTRGLNSFVRDSQPSLRHLLKRPVRRARVTHIPPLRVLS